MLGDDGSSSYQFLSGYDYPGAGYVFGTEAYKGLGFRGLSESQYKHGILLKR